MGRQTRYRFCYIPRPVAPITRQGACPGSRCAPCGEPVLRLDPLPALNDNYIWLLADTDGNALVVDPGAADVVEEALATRKLRLTTILLTHHHADHTGGVASLCKHHACVVYAPHDTRIDNVDRRVGDGDIVAPAAPATRFRVWEVPGHTRSHIAFVGDDLVFCGDTLFSLGCGRLFEGSPEQMLTSLDRLASLPDATRVCCAHEYTLANGAFARTVEPANADLAQRMQAAHADRADGRPTLPSRMDAERATNPFLRVDAPAVMHWAGNQQTGWKHRVERFAALRAAKDGFRA